MRVDKILFDFHYAIFVSFLSTQQRLFVLFLGPSAFPQRSGSLLFLFRDFRRPTRLRGAAARQRAVGRGE